MLSAINAPISFEPLDKKVTFSTSLINPSKIKQVSETSIEFGNEKDTIAKVIALKAPLITIQSLLSASKKLVIHTDVLVIDGGYITQPKQWDIQAKEVRLKNVSEDSQWIASLIQNTSGKRSIESSNFISQAEVDCNFDIAQAPPLTDRIVEIATELRDFKEKLFSWR